MARDFLYNPLWNLVYTAAKIKEFLFSIERDNFMKSIKATLGFVVAVFLASSAAQAGDAEKGKKSLKNALPVIW